MSKKNKNDDTRGKVGFDLYYSEVFGERWNHLKESLLEESTPVSYKLSSDLRTYFLDKASIFAASILPLKNVHSILDLCAAPGGKTLVISSLMEEDAILTSNERSFDRKQRLVKVCDEHLPESIRQRVNISCSDGALWCKTKKECFQRILLDAPCSSERHVLQDEKYLLQWSPARIKTLSMEQWALLSSAYRMLEPEGILVYSTCALAPKENDEVIKKLLKKFPDAKVISFESDEYKIRNVSFDELQKRIANYSPNFVFPDYEKTELGYQILPDKQNGAGPIYFSMILKNIN